MFEFILDRNINQDLSKTMLSQTKFRHILVTLSVCSLAYIRPLWPTHNNKRILSTNSCGEPVKQCPEGEEAYFSSYPDVSIKWKSAYQHWKKYGKAEGRHYICMCPTSDEKILSDNECGEPVKKCPEGEDAYFRSNQM